MDTIYYYLPFLETIRDFLELGGIALYAIGILTLFMWILIIERLIYFNSGHRRMVAATQEIWGNREDHQSWNAHQVRSRLISVVGRSMDRNLPLIQTCVALCPLLGLFGTVWGMINVFEVMAVSGSGNVRAMAAGVSQATVPTMAGMVGALSGVLLVTILSRRAAHEVQFLEDSLTMDH